MRSLSTVRVTATALPTMILTSITHLNPQVSDKSKRTSSQDSISAINL